MYDLISIGDAGIDTLVDLHEESAQCSLNREESLICLRYADKILVDGMTSKTAYNGMNVAVGAKRLALKTSLYATVGGDHAGRRILNVLEREGVDTRHMVVEKKLRTNASVVLDYNEERTILVYHEDYHYRLPRLARQTKWVYLTTMGKRYAPVYAAVTRFISHGRTKLAFNPGSFQLKAGVRKLKAVLGITGVLFVNKEEARLLTSNQDERDIKELLRGLLKLGPKIAVVTDGPKGSYASDGEHFYSLSVLPIKIVERTGAGDSYATGFVAALIHGHDLKEAMRWGAVNSASVIEQIGPQDGLLKLAELHHKLRIHPRFQPRLI